MSLSEFVGIRPKLFPSLFFAVMMVVCLGLISPSSFAQSFNCAKAANAAEKAICADDELKSLDSKMADLYNKALAKASAKDKRTMRSEQAGWIKSRNECMKRENGKACINDFYTQRISYLEPMVGGSAQGSSQGSAAAITDKVTYSCTAGPEIVVSFMGQEKVSVEAGDKTMTLSRAQSGSGAKYSSSEATFWTQGKGAQFDYMGKSHKCQEKR